MVGPSKEANQYSHDVIGAALEVHRKLGPGFLESVYEEALCVELDLRGIPYSRQVPIAVNYRDHQVGESRLDLLVGDTLIVELKAVERLNPIHSAQALSYLKATEYRLALLINFNTLLLMNGIKRIAL